MIPFVRFGWIDCSGPVGRGLVVLLALVLCACGGASSGSSGYEQELMQERVQRDMQMREKESVIPPDRRSAFRGLDYYAADTTYRYVVSLQRSAPDTVWIPESTGDLSPQLRVGHVPVPLPGGEQELVVFRGASDDPRGRLWVPFADATNADSTYEAGRYVDLQRTEGDSVIVDFNRAYNPTCAYNPDFACPLPPSENRMDGPVPVGEKRPQFAGSS
jgi:uncharacterized protein (DUF1684 family)